MEQQFETISIQFTKEDTHRLKEQAKKNRLKLSSYLRSELTKNLD